jgi:hypothetical protein
MSAIRLEVVDVFFFDTKREALEFGKKMDKVLPLYYSQPVSQFRGILNSTPEGYVFTVYRRKY